MRTKKTVHWGMTVGLMLAMGAALAGPFVSSKGYALTPPAGWRVDKSGMMGTDVVVIAPTVGGFAPNLNVVITPAPPGQTLDAAPKQIAAMYPRVFSDYKSMSQSFGTLGGVRTLRVMGTYTRAGRRLRMRQVIALKNGSAYTFTCTEPEAVHAKLDPAFDKMLASIRWTK